MENNLSIPAPPAPPINQSMRLTDRNSSSTSTPLHEASSITAPAAPPPMPPKRSTAETPNWKTKQATKQKPQFQYSRGDPYKIDWDHIEDLKISDSGAAGVVFVNTKGNGSVVIKGSSTIVQDFFATLVAEALGFNVAHMRIIDWSSPDEEWAKMLREMGNFANKRDPGGFEERKIRKEIGERCFLEAMEMICGVPLSALALDQAGKLFSGESAESVEFLQQIGDLIALDIFLHNWDRVPLIWGNPGNWGNLILSSENQKFKLVGIDNGYSFIDPQHSSRLQGYLSKVDSIITDLVAAASMATELADMNVIRESFHDATGFSIPPNVLIHTQYGILRGLKKICDTATEALLVAIVTKVEGAIQADWGNIWTSGMKTINSTFLNSVLSTIKSKQDAIESALQSFSRASIGEPFRILVMQSLPFSATNIDETLLHLGKTIEQSQVHIDLVMYPEGANMEPYNAHQGALEEVNQCVKKFCDFAAQKRIYALPGTFVERSQGKVYTTAAVINREGKFIGTYRKRKPVATEKTSAGDRALVFEIPELKGKVAVLICFDIENADIINENLSYNPVLILNPVHIGNAPLSATAHDTRQLDLAWRNAVDGMRRKLEKTALDHCVDIVRCDMARPAGAGSSQHVGPCSSILGPSADSSSFIVEIYPKGSINRILLGSSPERPRTANEDNTLNRFCIRSVRAQEGSLLPRRARCVDTTKPNASQPTADVVVEFEDGSFRIWDRISPVFAEAQMREIGLQTSQPAHQSQFKICEGNLVSDLNGERLVHLDGAFYAGFTDAVQLSPTHIACSSRAGKIVLFDNCLKTVHHVMSVSDRPLRKLEFNMSARDLYLLALDEEHNFFCVEFTQNNFAVSPTTMFSEPK